MGDRTDKRTSNYSKSSRPCVGSADFLRLLTEHEDEGLRANHYWRKILTSDASCWVQTLLADTKNCLSTFGWLSNDWSIVRVRSLPREVVGADSSARAHWSRDGRGRLWQPAMWSKRVAGQRRAASWRRADV